MYTKLKLIIQSMTVCHISCYIFEIQAEDLANFMKYVECVGTMSFLGFCLLQNGARHLKVV